MTNVASLNNGTPSFLIEELYNDRFKFKGILVLSLTEDDLVESSYSNLSVQEIICLLEMAKFRVMESVP